MIKFGCGFACFVLDRDEDAFHISVYNKLVSFLVLHSSEFLDVLHLSPFVEFSRWHSNLLALVLETEFFMFNQELFLVCVEANAILAHITSLAVFCLLVFWKDVRKIASDRQIVSPFFCFIV
eukprot:TRINITY_DN6555_c0_g3_i1.p3 TRINITY_DN6555_c0_g3~~TRINITY_DN6555_c0_g3_i1.p3  ORF type:complete len:122 (-),score=16.75 TRINITY_DN6555_c0_g3_i1:8-373(-)